MADCFSAMLLAGTRRGSINAQTGQISTEERRFSPCSARNDRPSYASSMRIAFYRCLGFELMDEARAVTGVYIGTRKEVLPWFAAAVDSLHNQGHRPFVLLRA